MHCWTNSYSSIMFSDNIIHFTINYPLPNFGCFHHASKYEKQQRSQHFMDRLFEAYENIPHE